MERLAFGARHFGKLFRLSKNTDRLVCDLLAERSEAHQAARAFNQGNTEQASSSRRPADSVDWVTKQASAALPKCP